MTEVSWPSRWTSAAVPITNFGSLQSSPPHFINTVPLAVPSRMRTFHECLLAWKEKQLDLPVQARALTSTEER